VGAEPLSEGESFCRPALRALTALLPLRQFNRFAVYSPVVPTRPDTGLAADEPAPGTRERMGRAGSKIKQISQPKYNAFLTPRVGINKSNLYGVARGAIGGRFSNIMAVAVWWNTSPSVASIITRLSRRECPSGRQQKNWSNSRAVGNMRPGSSTDSCSA
jgi:hypothetical protein